MAETYIQDYKARAREDLPSQFYKPRIEALVAALACGVQILEDDVFDLLVSSGLSSATGRLLDAWGALVSEARLGLTDDIYRRIIQAKLKAVRSSGSEGEMKEVLELLTASSEVSSVAKYPAEIHFDFLSEGLSATEAGRIVRIMTLAKPAGVSLYITETLVGGFIFDDAMRGFDRAPLGRRIV